MTRRCKHCKKPKQIRSRGLCSWCYQHPEVRAKYPVTPGYDRRHAKGLSARQATLAARHQRLPVRQGGEPPGRCFWCLRFRCDGESYFQVCAECQQQYNERSANMPPGDATDSWSFEAGRCGDCGKVRDGKSTVCCNRCRKKRTARENRRRQKTLATRGVGG